MCRVSHFRGTDYCAAGRNESGLRAEVALARPGITRAVQNAAGPRTGVLTVTDD